VAVLDDDPVLGLVCGLDLRDGHHDHVVVVAVADQLVATALDDLRRALVELEREGRSEPKIDHDQGLLLSEHHRAELSFTLTPTKDDPRVKTQLQGLYLCFFGFL